MAQGVIVCVGGQRTANHQHQRIGWADRQEYRAGGEGADDGCDNGGVKTVDRAYAGDDGKAHRQRGARGCTTGPGQQVGDEGIAERLQAGRLDAHLAGSLH